MSVRMMEIYFCFECRYYHDGIIGPMCLKSGEKIDDLSDIPMWCELPKKDWKKEIKHGS